jgi:hypothetical protein
MIEPLFRDRTQAIHFPGQMIAELLTKAWHEKTKSPLVYVTGDEHAANSIAVYSPDHPHVIVYGDLRSPASKSPWATVADVEKRGVLLVWEAGGGGENVLGFWQANFPGFDPANASVIDLPLQSHRAKTIRFRYVMIPPKP